MLRNNPPMHRHDGTSPLPLGMDWSIRPKKWDGSNTIWPHDPRTGWSYCVMIPSWIVQPESVALGDKLLNPVIFYRVLVGIQSPQGICTSNVVLRRFSDFLKLFSALKKVFPRKNLPAAPPKHALLRINSSHMLLEERRFALEEWIGKLLADIEVSRSAPVAAFLELEAAARSSFQGAGSQSPELSSQSSAASFAGSSAVSSMSHSLGSDAALDDTHEVINPGLLSQEKACTSEASVDNLELDNDTSGDLANGLFEGGSGESNIGQQQELMRKFNIQARKERASVLGDSSKEPTHARKLSEDSIVSDICSSRDGEILTLGVGSNFIADGGIDFQATFASSFVDEFGSSEMPFSNEKQIIFPLDQRQKLNRIIFTLQRRVMTAKADMEDLIDRLNKEIAVKEYLATRVKDLEGELEITQKKSKENLQQAIVVERERFTQMQWDADELRRKSLEMESMLKFEQDEKIRAQSEKAIAMNEKELLLQELEAKQKELDLLKNNFKDSELKSKADVKVLVKEVKNLRSSQKELKEDLDNALKVNAELEEVIKMDSTHHTRSRNSLRKFLHECELLHKQLEECSVDVLTDEDKSTKIPSISEKFELLTTSDNRIGLLLAQAQLLASEEHTGADASSAKSSPKFLNGDFASGGDDQEIRKMLAELLTENARIRMKVNFSVRLALKDANKQVKDDTSAVPSSRKTVLNKFLEK